MHIIVCVDDDLGMAFNGRRQSQDSVVRRRIAEMGAQSRVWMSQYSKRQFQPEEITQHMNFDDNFLSEALDGDYCFVELEDLTRYEPWIETLTLIRWNRSYPSDIKLTLDLSKWKMLCMAFYEGNSHSQITEETYIKDEKE